MRIPFFTTLLVTCSCWLLFSAVACKAKVITPAEPVTTTKPRPLPDDDYIPIQDDGEVNGPGTETTYAPTEYVDLPVRKKRPGNAIPAAANQCDFVGEIWDFEENGNCTQVVETTNGYLLSITGLPQGYFLEAGSRIRFGFSYDDVNPSACTLTDGSVRITCLQLLRSASGFRRPMVCRSYDRPSQWIYELIQDLSATYVTRFPWEDGRVVYLFETASGQYLYDCRGFILCQPRTNCLQFIEDFNEGVQIYEG